MTSIQSSRSVTPASQGTGAYPPGMVPVMQQPGVHWPHPAQRLYAQSSYNNNPYPKQPEPEPEKKPLQMYVVPKTLRTSTSRSAANKEKKTRAEILEDLDKVIEQNKSEGGDQQSNPFGVNDDRTSPGSQAGTSSRNLQMEKSEKSSEQKLEQLKKLYKKADPPIATSHASSNHPSKDGLRRLSDLSRSSNSKRSLGDDGVRGMRGLEENDEEPNSLNLHSNISDQKMDVLAEEDFPSPATSPTPSPSASARNTSLASEPARSYPTRMQEEVVSKAKEKERDEEREAEEEWERQLLVERELAKKQRLPPADASCQTTPEAAPRKKEHQTQTDDDMTTETVAEPQKPRDLSSGITQDRSMAEVMGVPVDKVAAFAHSSHLILERMLVAVGEMQGPRRSSEVDAFIANATSTRKDSNYNIALASAALMKKLDPSDLAAVDDARVRHEEIAARIEARLTAIISS